MSPPKRCRIIPVGFSAFLQPAVFRRFIVYMGESGKYGATMKKRLRYRQAPIDPHHPRPSESQTAGKSNNNKPAHPHYCSGNPG
jgi:hypothetical protein